MGAATGTALFPGSSTFPDTTVYPGQGTQPYVRCRFSFDTFDDPTPSWSEVTNSDFRSFSTSRGRDNEQSQFDAGSASVVLDNRDRAYDPNFNASILPMNRIWLYEEFSGEVHDLFKGYVESWIQGWPGGGWSDAVVTASAVDEFKILNLQTVPATSPPRASYEDLLSSDQPTGYWRLNEDPSRLVQEAISATDPNPPPPFWGRWWRGGGNPGPQW